MRKLLIVEIPYTQIETNVNLTHFLAFEPIYFTFPDICDIYLFFNPFLFFGIQNTY